MPFHAQTTCGKRKVQPKGDWCRCSKTFSAEEEFCSLSLYFSTVIGSIFVTREMIFPSFVSGLSHWLLVMLRHHLFLINEAYLWLNGAHGHPLIKHSVVEPKLWQTDVKLLL